MSQILQRRKRTVLNTAAWYNGYIGRVVLGHGTSAA